jgi:putative methyltransferase
VRGADGMPILKSTGKKVLEMKDLEEEGVVEVRFWDDEDDDGDGPFERDENGRIVRGPDGMPRLKKGKGVREVVVAERGSDEDEDEEEEEEDEWGGFDD